MRHSSGTVLFVVLAMLSGCSAETGIVDHTPPADPGPTVEPADPDAPVRGLLEVVGDVRRVLDAGAESTIEIRYTLGGRPGTGPVDFAIDGDGRGASLSGRSAETDASGIARLTLRTAAEGTFDVMASRGDVEMPAVVHVTVSRLRFGALDVTVAYSGTRDVRTAELALFTNTTCAALARTVPSPTAQQALPRLGAAGRFEGVEIGLPIAIYALGIDNNDTVAADGCIDSTLAGPSGSATAPLADIPELMGGTYALQSTFDVTMGVNPTLDAILDGFHGIATDPASYVVDLVRSSSGAPGWLRDALGFGPTRAIIVGILRDALDGIYVPGYLAAVLDTGSDLDVALSNATFVSDLTLGEPNEFTAMAATHTVRELRVPLDGATVTTPIAGASATFDVAFDQTAPGMIVLPEHDLAIPFGRLVQTLLDEVLLPRLPGSPHSLTDLARNLVPCDRVASAIVSEDGTTQNVVNAVCDVGVTLLGGYLDSKVEDLFRYDTLHYAARGRLADTDHDYARETIDMGTAAGRWTGADGEMAFTGTMSGARPDAQRRHHPIRDRMHEVR